MFTLRPVAGSFQHTLWPRRGVLEAALLFSCAFVFVFIWYKVIIALSLCLPSGALQYTAHTSIVAAKIASLKFFFETQYFGPNLRLAQTKTAILIRSVQNADCRQRTKCRLGTKCRQNLYCFLVWYVINWLTWGTGPTNTYTHTHTNKKDTVCLMTSTHPTSSPHNLFSNSHHDEYTSFLITQLPKNKKKIYSKSLESSHKPNSTVPLFSKSKKSMQT